MDGFVAGGAGTTAAETGRCGGIAPQEMVPHGKVVIDGNRWK
jgi:hypothetical protein